MLTHKHNSRPARVGVSAAAVIAVALVALASREARAYNEVSLRLSSVHLVDRGVEAFNKTPQMVMAELSYARALFGPQRGLWIEASWSITGARDDLFGSELSSHGTFNTLTVGARVTWPLWSWLVPQARAGIGVVIGRLTVEGSGTGLGSVSDTSAGMSAYALAGVQLLLPRRWMRREDRSGFTVGFVIEGGIILTTPMSFALTPQPDEDLRTIPLSGVDAGDITLTAGVVRFGFLMRF